MARVREEVNRWPISPERRARVLAGVAPPLWRAIREQEVRTRGELAAVVRGLVRLLQEAEGVSGSLKKGVKPLLFAALQHQKHILDPNERGRSAAPKK